VVSACPNTFCQRGSPPALGFSGAPVSLSKSAAACHFTWSASAGANPFPLVVRTCTRRGPFIFFTCSKVSVSRFTSCPSTGPT
jgi:hypothetical protein